MPFRFGTDGHPGPTFFTLIRRVLQQPDAALERMLVLARESPSFGSPAELDAIIRDVDGSDPHVLASAIPTLSQMVADAAEPSTVGTDLFEALMLISPSETKEVMDAKRQYFIELLDALVSRRNDVRVRELAQSVGAVLLRTEWRVELAAVIGKEQEIPGFLPMAVLNLHTDDPSHRNVVLQFDEERLASFQRDLERIALEFAAVRRATADRLTLFRRGEG